MKGSGVWTTSTSPFARAAGMAGNGITVYLTWPESTPRLSSAPRTTISATPLRTFRATVFPARSAGVRIELEPRTTTFCQLSASDVPSVSLAATTVIGIPWVRPIIAGVYPI